MPASELSLFQRRCQNSFFGLMASLRKGLSAWPSQNMRTVRRLCRLEGHSDGVVGSILASKEPEAGLALIAARGRLMQALPENGEMLAVMGTVAQIEPILQKENGSRDRAARVEIAAFNGPRNVVVAGAREGVRAVARQLESQGLRSRALTVSHAFHSPLMEPMLAEFAATARTVTYAAPQLPVVSNITGELAAADIATPDYWVRQVRQPVLVEAKAP